MRRLKLAISLPLPPALAAWLLVFACDTSFRVPLRATAFETNAVETDGAEAEPDRSPSAVVLTADESRLLTANQTAGTLSLVDVASGEVLDEVACGRRPSALALTPDGKQVAVTSSFSGELRLFDLGEKLRPAGVLFLGFEPRGVAVSPDGTTAYVALVPVCWPVLTSKSGR